MGYNSDPRVIRFREADKQEKADRKKAKADAAKARRDEEERIKREAEEKERAEKEAEEEDKESGSDRDERRWIEKNNRVQRAERKKEEMKRIRSLVDNAYNSDPRVIRFREADKQEKADRKKAKADAT